MYKCVIIDDEQHAIDGLKSYLETVPELILINSYLDPLIALKNILISEPVDIIFLDVDMPRINGIELANEIRSKTKKLVFTTGHTKYAYEAFEANADAYLLKPYSLGKFIIAINKLFPESISPAPVIIPANQPNDFFFVKSKEDDLKIVKIRYDEIIMVEGQQNYVMIHTLSKKVLTYMSLNELNKMLAAFSDFMQLHRSFIVNLNQIETIDGSYVKLKNGTRLTVGDNFKKSFNDFVAERLVIKAGKQK